MASKNNTDIQVKDLDSWKRGQISYFSKSRMQEDALKAAYNVVFDYDAIVRPRGSFNASGIPDVPIIERRTAAAAVVSTNLVVNPSFETNTTGWGGLNGGTISRVTTQARDGSASLQVVATSGSESGVAYNASGLTQLATYTVSAYVKVALGVTLRFQVNTFATNTYSRSLIVTVVGTGEWQRVSQTITLTGSENRMDIFPNTNGVANTFFVDSVLLQAGSTLTNYFDGSFTDGLAADYEWTGTAHASTSTRAAYTVETITPQPLGCDFAFKRPDGTEGLLNVFSDGEYGYLYVLKPDLSGWDKFSDTFDKDATVSFDQIAGVVVMGNGIEKFTYLEIASSTVKRLIRVPDPSQTPTATPTGFSGTNALDYYYRVAFNGIGGSTKMTPAVKISSSTIRDTWGSSKSVAISIDGFTIDPNAPTWNVYVASVSTGTGAPTDTEYMKIAENIPVTQKQHTDTGAVTMLQSAPVENTTEGIVAWYYKNISGRLWAIGNDGLVHWGGDVGNELYFGSANGSDSYMISSNGIEKPMAIALGRDNAGTTCINILSRTMAGQGAIWDVYATTNSISANGQTFSTGTYQFKKREGNDGTDAPWSVIHENNNAYYLSMDGFKSTGVKPNVSGIQATDIISSAIRDRVLNLTQSNLNNTYAAYYDESLYWTVAYGSEKSNEIWVYDILHGGIWSIWRIDSDCIFRWASTTNESPSLYIRQGNKLLRYYKNSHTHADASGTFESYIESGLIPFGKTNLEWVHLLKSLWQFDQAVGVIDLTVNIHSKNGDIVKVNRIPFNGAGSSTAATSGWDAIQLNDTNSSGGSWNNRAWEETMADLLGFLDPSDKKVSQKIRKNASYISFSVRAETPDTYYELSHVSLLFTYIGLGVEFLSQKGVIKI